MELSIFFSVLITLWDISMLIIVETLTHYWRHKRPLMIGFDQYGNSTEFQLSQVLYWIKLLHSLEIVDVRRWVFWKKYY